MYYRVAIQGVSQQEWRWKSTVLRSLDTLFHFLRLHRNIPQNRLRVFSASSPDSFHELLRRENSGLGSHSVPAAQFLQERMLCVPEVIDTVAPDENAAHTTPASDQSQGKSNDKAIDQVSAWMSMLERRRIELEFGAGGDHDCAYTFSLPTSTSLVVSWKELLLRIQSGVLQP